MKDHSIKSDNILFIYWKLFSSDTHQSLKTSDSDLKVDGNIYLDAVTCDRIRLIGPKCDQLGPINHCLLEESQWENEVFLSIHDWVLSLDVNRFQTLKWKDDLACPMIRKFSSVYVLERSGFAISCCHMADSQLILELLLLHIRRGCALTASSVVPTDY